MDLSMDGMNVLARSQTAFASSLLDGILWPSEKSSASLSLPLAYMVHISPELNQDVEVGMKHTRRAKNVGHGRANQKIQERLNYSI